MNCSRDWNSYDKCKNFIAECVSVNRRCSNRESDSSQQWKGTFESLSVGAAHVIDSLSERERERGSGDRSAAYHRSTIYIYTLTSAGARKIVASCSDFAHAIFSALSPASVHTVERPNASLNGSGAGRVLAFFNVIFLFIINIDDKMRGHEEGKFQYQRPFAARALWCVCACDAIRDKNRSRGKK